MHPVRASLVAAATEFTLSLPAAAAAGATSAEPIKPLRFFEGRTEGMAARNSMKVHRFGMIVGTSDETIRKIAGS